MITDIQIKNLAAQLKGKVKEAAKEALVNLGDNNLQQAEINLRSAADALVVISFMQSLFMEKAENETN